MKIARKSNTDNFNMYHKIIGIMTLEQFYMRFSKATTNDLKG